MLRRLATLGGIATIGVLGLVGCGGSNGTSTVPGADAQEVIAVIKGYYAAQVDGDAQRACGYLTPARQAELIQALKEPNSGPGPPPVDSCAAALASMLAIPSTRGLAQNAEVSEVKVSANSAKAVANTTSPNGKSTSTANYVLTKANGQWKIALGNGLTTNVTTSTSR